MKKLIALLLVLCMALGMVACGAKAPETPKNDEPKVETQNNDESKTEEPKVEELILLPLLPTVPLYLVSATLVPKQVCL